MKHWGFMVGWAAFAFAPYALADDVSAKPSGKVEFANPGGALVINVSKWSRADKGENKGLIVWYEWEGGVRSRAEVSASSAYWVVRFPSRPDVGKTGTIDYTFTFDLSPADKATLDNATAGFEEKSAIYFANIALKYAEAISAESASKAAPTDAVKAKRSAEAQSALSAAHEAQFGPVLESLAPLDGFTDDEGNAAKDVLLKAVGFEHDAATDRWKPTHAAGVFASQTAGQDTTKDSATNALKELEGRLTGASSCVTAAKKKPRTITADLDAYATCSGELKAGLTADKDHATAPALLERLDKEVAAFKDKPAEATIEAVVRARKALAAALSTPAPSGAVVQAQLGIQVLVNDLLIQQADADASTRTTALHDKITETRIRLISAQRATDILKQEGSRRDFDVASGIVYVGDIDEWVFPILVAWCPVGCLRPDAGFDEVQHMISVDFGLRTGMIDTGKQIDPRHDHDTVSPMLGISLNPVAFARLSGGAYYFNNLQTNRWNFRPYVGVTMDLVRLAEVTKLVGLGDPPKPKLEPKP